MSPAVSSLDKKGKGFPEQLAMLANATGARVPTDTWLAVARTALGNGEPERCKVILKACLEGDRNVPASLLLSTACLELGTEEGVEEGVASARSALSHASNPDDVARATTQLAVALGTRARMHTGQQLDRQQDRSEAVQLLTQIVDPTPTSPASASPASGPPSASASYTLAVLQAEAGQGAAAMAAARRALAAAQAGREQQLTALCLALVAALLSSRHQHRLALSVLSAAPPPPPPSPRPSSGGPEPAAGAGPGGWADVLLARLRSRLLAAQSDAVGALSALAGCKRLLGGWVEGRVPLPEGVSRRAAEEALMQVWGELAVALASGGQRPEALAAADHARALRPWSAPACHCLGAVHEALGEYDEAAAAYGSAAACDPTHGPTLLRQGALAARRGGRADLAVARELLAEALRYDPASAAAWYQLGRVAAALGHREEAEAHLLTAVQLAGAAPVLPYSQLPLAPPHAAV